MTRPMARRRRVGESFTYRVILWRLPMAPRAFRQNTASSATGDPGPIPASIRLTWCQEAKRSRNQGDQTMRKSLPELMFSNPEQSRLTMLRDWVLNNEVTQIAMTERQFWNL